MEYSDTLKKENEELEQRHKILLLELEKIQNHTACAPQEVEFSEDPPLIP
jgi:hypothetical protein